MRIDLQQGSEAWVEWRGKGIGGSDAGTIMCENRFETIYALWAKKIGQRPPKRSNAAMARGNKLEDAGRMAFVQKVGEFFIPACIEHDEYRFMRTSLDGISPDGELAFELKIPETPHTHLIAREGQVPRIYYAQCQHNLFVSGARKLFFVSWYPKDEAVPLAEVPVFPDFAYRTEMIAAETEFWKWVTEKRFPFEAAKNAKGREANLSTDPEWVRLAGMLWEADAMRAMAEERYNDIRGQMERIAMKTGQSRVRGAGVLASWVHTMEYQMTKPETKYLRIGHSASDGEGEE